MISEAAKARQVCEMYDKFLGLLLKFSVKASGDEIENSLNT